MSSSPFRGTLVATPDVKLFVQERGKGDAVLMLAGLGYASWCWEDLMLAFDPRWRTLAVDMRGTGRSDKPPGPYSIPQFADDLAHVIVAMKLSRVHLVGFSMGGYVALTLVTRYPELVRSMVLVSTSRGGPGTLPVPVSTREVWREASKLSSREFAETTMPLSYSVGWPERNPQRFRDILEKRLAFPTPPSCWAAQYEAAEHYVRHGVDVSGIRQPALVIHGTEDRIVPYENGIKLATSLRSAQLMTLQRVGHLPFLEDPADFARRVCDFLDQQERAGV